MKVYLSSYDYYSFQEPRQILHYQKIKVGNRNTLIVEVDRPLIGQKYGWEGNVITTFYLVNRVDENAFDKLDKFPIEVHVTATKTHKAATPTSLSELQNIAWACLYDNEQDAIEHKI